MCKSPTKLPDGTEVACRLCSLCRERAVNDWVGRNIAETKTAKAAFAVTLTYGRNRAGDVDHERASVLTYSDFQKFIKLLRFHGHDVRYHVTGEYGSQKGRAHWHAMLYFMDSKPAVVLDKNWHWEAVNADGQRVFGKNGEPHFFWPHGYAFITKPNFHSVRYNCKYIMKGMGEDERQGHMGMSKKPPLGTRYFQQVAEQYVRQGLSPQDLFYVFPEVRRRKKDGTDYPIPFLLKGRPAELFLDHFIEQWREAYGEQPWPRSDLVDLYVEWGRVVRDEDAAWDRYTAHITTRKILGPGPSHMDLVQPLRCFNQQWFDYIRSVGLGTERQQRSRDEQWLVEYRVAYEQCAQAGADLIGWPEPQFVEPWWRSYLDTRDDHGEQSERPGEPWSLGLHLRSSSPLDGWWIEDEPDEDDGPDEPKPADA